MNLIICTSKENPDKKKINQDGFILKESSEATFNFPQNMIIDDLYDSLPGMTIDQEERVLYVADSVSSKIIVMFE